MRAWQATEVSQQLRDEDGEVVAELRRGLEVGGGRGWFATVALETGTRLYTERAVWSLPDGLDSVESGESVHVALTREMLQRPPEQRHGILQQLVGLYPLSLAPQHIHPHVLQSCEQRHQQNMAQLMRQQTEPPLPQEVVLCLLLKVQLNAFYSGAYVKSSLLNHSCRPNCIKLALSPDSDGGKGRGSSQRASSVFVSRPIAAGEEITISYLIPCEQSLERRRQQLQEQHCFDLQESCYAGPLEEIRGSTTAEIEDLNDRDAPTAPVVDKSSTSSAMQQLLALEDDIEKLEREVEQLETTGCADASISPFDSSSEAGGFAQQATALIGQLKDLVGDSHVVYVRANKCLIRCCQAQLIQNEMFPVRSSGSNSLDDEAQVRVAILRAAEQMYSIQQQYLHEAAYDIALSLDVLHENFEWFLGRQPQALFKAFPDRYSNFAAASKMDATLRKNLKAFDSLYR